MTTGYSTWNSRHRISVLSRSKEVAVVIWKASVKIWSFFKKIVKFSVDCSMLGHLKAICRRSRRSAMRKIWGKCLRARLVVLFFYWLIPWILLLFGPLRLNFTVRVDNGASLLTWFFYPPLTNRPPVLDRPTRGVIMAPQPQISSTFHSGVTSFPPMPRNLADCSGRRLQRS